MAVPTFWPLRSLSLSLPLSRFPFDLKVGLVKRDVDMIGQVAVGGHAMSPGNQVGVVAFVVCCEVCGNDCEARLTVLGGVNIEDK